MIQTINLTTIQNDESDNDSNDEYDNDSKDGGIIR